MAISRLFLRDVSKRAQARGYLSVAHLWESPQACVTSRRIYTVGVLIGNEHVLEALTDMATSALVESNGQWDTEH